MPPVRLPPELSRLLTAPEGAERETAWEAFIAAHSSLLLHSCRSLARDADAAMDGFTHVLASLSEKECRRLRAYVPDGRTQFTTWLVVVTRRLFLDHYRQKYGRARSEETASRDEHVARRRLEDLLASDVDPDHLIASDEHSPDLEVRRRDLGTLIQRALADLHPADQLLLALRYEDDRPVREIARQLQMPSVFHVYRRLNVVLEMLRRTLARRGITSSDP